MSGEPETTPNPYAVTTLELTATLPDTRGVAPSWMRVLVIGTCTFLVIGTAVACIDVESIIFTGPILFVLGVVFAAVTYPQTRRPFRFLAWGGLSFPILCVLLINLFSWSPNDAQIPISLLCVAFTALIGRMSATSLRRLPPAESGDGSGGGLSDQSSEPELGHDFGSSWSEIDPAAGRSTDKN